MKKPRISADAGRDLLVVFSAAVLFLLPLLIHLSPGLTRYAYAPYSFFLLQPEEVVEEAVPEYAGVRRTYTFHIPEGNAATVGARLIFYLRHTNAQVSIEDSDLYYDSSETDDPHIAHTPGNYWVSVPVRPVYAGKAVHVTLTPVYRSVRGETPIFWLIGHEQLLTMVLLPQDALMLSLSAVAVIAGAFLALFALVLPRRRRDKRQLLYLGAISVTAGVWKLTGLESVVLLLDTHGWHKEIWFLGASSYMLMLLLSLRLLICIRAGRIGRAEQLCFAAAAALALGLSALQLFNVLELHDMLAPYGLALAALHLIALFSQKPSKTELFWFLPLLLTLGLDLMAYRLSGTLHNAPVFLIWSLIHMAVRGFGFIRVSLKQEQLLRKRESELRETRVRFLVNQIQPHFIYNSLSTIYALCRSDPARARGAIEEFNDYLMANFSGISATKPIPFSEELQHTKAYLTVEAMLHGEELTVIYDTPHTGFLLPALTLQPIVENSVKHGMDAGHPNMCITIRTRYIDGGSEIVVEDDGAGFDPSSVADDARRIGLQSVRDRLGMMCGGTLDVASAPGSGARVTVFVPRIE